MRTGQVTIYIIIGLVLVLAVGIGVYIFTSIGKLPVERLPPEKLPISLFVEECIQKVSSDSLVASGLHGGVLDVAQLQKEKDFAAVDPFNTDVLSLYDGNLLLPYWYYQKSELDRVNIPILEKRFTGDKSIQDQLETHISEQLMPCLDGFNVFKKQNVSVTPTGSLKTSVLFADDATKVSVVYPLEITKPQGREMLSEFSVTLPIRYKQLYTLAKEITSYELDRVFLEESTTNLLAIYSRTDPDYLPPIYGDAVIGDCANRVFWTAPEVEKNLKTMLASNVPFWHVADTHFDPMVIDSSIESNKRNRAIRQGVFTGMVHQVPLTKNVYGEDVEVLFNYDESFPLQLNLGKGGLLEPSEFNINALFGQFCMFDYSFVYNLKYPVLINLLDKKSTTENGEFLFQFPIQVVLKNNFPRLLLYAEPDPGITDLPDNQCSKELRLSDESTITITDTENKPLHHVLVYYQCGPASITTFNPATNFTRVESFAQKCFMGQTDKGRLSTKFPLCTGGGVLSFVKNGYLEKMEFVGPIERGGEGSQQEKQQNHFEKTITLDAVKDFTVHLQKYFVKPASEEPIANPGVVLENGVVAQCNAYTEPRQLVANENALIKITKLDEDQGILRGITTVYYRGNETNKITLGPGKYRADITLLRNERYQDEQTIRKDSQMRTIPGSLPSSSKTVTYPENDVELPTIFTGGALIEFEVTQQQMEQDEVTFSVFDEGPPRRLEDVGRAVINREGCSTLNQQLVMPIFSS